MVTSSTVNVLIVIIANRRQIAFINRVGRRSCRLRYQIIPYRIGILVIEAAIMPKMNEEITAIITAVYIYRYVVYQY